MVGKVLFVLLFYTILAIYYNVHAFNEWRGFFSNEKKVELLSKNDINTNPSLKLDIAMDKNNFNELGGNSEFAETPRDKTESQLARHNNI